MPNKPNCVHDFVVFCYLLGNDFLPHSPSMHINDESMDLLFKAYNNIEGDLTTVRHVNTGINNTVNTMSRVESVLVSCK